jgi:ABC-type sugar transport system substrate-binding protein
MQADDFYVPFYRSDERVDGTSPELVLPGYKAGTTQAGLLRRDPGIKAIKGGDVLVFTGDVKFTGTISTTFARSQLAEDALQAFPDLRGVFAINDPAALGARAALEKAGKADQVKIIGFDGQPEGKQAIRDGKIYADPIQFPDKMGTQTVEAIVRWSKGEALPPQTLIPTSLYRKADAEQDPSLAAEAGRP